jgi:DNA ligase-1
MTYNFKAMLATEALPGQVTYPKLMSPKHNGWRGMINNGGVLARSLKPINNLWTQDMLGDPKLNGLDGELIVGPTGDPDVFTRTGGALAREDGKPNVRLFVFDVFDRPDLNMTQRIEVMHERLDKAGNQYAEAVPYVTVNSDEETWALAKNWADEGLEGGVLRGPESPYVYGRPTAETGMFLRVTPWYSGEMVIEGVKEGLENTNPVVYGPNGVGKRGMSKAGMIPTGMAGGIFGRDSVTGVEMGLAVQTNDDCKWFWENRLAVIGQLAKYRYKKPVSGRVPRFGQYVGLRHPHDMS